MTRLSSYPIRIWAHLKLHIESTSHKIHAPGPIIHFFLPFKMSGTGFSFGAKNIGLGGKPAASQPKVNAFGADSDNEDGDAPKEQKIGGYEGIKIGARRVTKISLGKPISKPLAARGVPPKRKPNLFADDDEKDDSGAKADAVEEVEIGEFGGIEIEPAKDESSASRKKETKGPPSKPPTAPPKAKAAQVNVYGDLSANLTSKKYGETAEALDSSIYDYDAVYDSMKPQKHEYEKDAEKKKDYMKALREAAALRKRDQVIAEERKLAKEREAEGDEFKDKEKFVTGAYKRQQEEARRLELEEKEREERETKENKKTGFTGFYKQMLERKENKHQELVNAAEKAAKEGPKMDEKKNDEEIDEVEKARRINEALGGEKIIINDDGQLVDKRQLLKGGLNVTTSKKAAAPAPVRPAPPPKPAANAFMGPDGGRGAMRERQSRMMEAQLEQAHKRAREEEEEERKKIESESKSRKTKDEIMGAKERYLQRKREAEEAKKKAAEGA